MFCDRKCSAKGRRAWVNREGNGQKEPLYCQHCGNEIGLRYAGKKYCSEKCKYAATRQRKREKVRESRSRGRDCVICGKWFVPSSEMEWICSDRCRASTCEGDVYIRITRPGSCLRADMQPEVGKIYRAQRSAPHNRNSVFWIVPGFGKFGVIIRSEEAREVKVTAKGGKA